MNQPQPTMFNSGQELAAMFVSSDLPSFSWAAISKPYAESSNPSSIEFKYEQTQIGTIIAFVPSSPCTAQDLQADLVSSATLGEDFLFRFVSTKVNPSFSINRAALDLFHSLLDKLSPLKDQAQQYVKANANSNRLIVTGHSIGGSVATLFTLWLLKSISPKENNRPLCITFGSPLIGDIGFQQAILERPTWNSCFLHVASTQDPILKRFISPQNLLPTVSTSTYKPSGTFLLCSESGCTCFEEPESILELMVAIGSDSIGTQGPSEGLQRINYGDLLKKLKLATICKGISGLGEWVATPLQTGIAIQIEAIKAGRTQQQEIGDANSLINKMVKRAADPVSRKRNVFDPNKKLNEMKINMSYVEWYKKVSVSNGGYYVAFKNMGSGSREELKMSAQIVKRKNILNQYWGNMVEEVEKMPQMEGAFFKKRWIRSGTNYRRLVEPFDIAEWYKKGKRGYLAQRPQHYLLLEKWQKENPGEQQNQGRTVACSLTEDSCFWAYVEEAIISCKLLNNGETSPEDKELSRENLVDFVNYVWNLITKYAVSTEIFLRQSSFMQWWTEYENIEGTYYHSPLVDFMRNHEYEQYK